MRHNRFFLFQYALFWTPDGTPDTMKWFCADGFDAFELAGEAPAKCGRDCDGQVLARQIYPYLIAFRPRVERVQVIFEVLWPKWLG